MNINASKLDMDKFRKVHSLMLGGATAGEKAAAKSRAEAMAARAGITLKQAIRSAAATSFNNGSNAADMARAWADNAERERATAPQAAPKSFFEEIFNSPEFQAERAERETVKAIKREAARKEYGSQEAVWAETEQEACLSAAVEHLKEWEEHTFEGKRHRYVSRLGGCREFYKYKDVPKSVADAVANAYPFPETMRGLLVEYLQWDKVYLDRNLFDSFEHWHWVEARVALIRHALETKPVQNWQDMQARMDWWQVVLDWQSNMPLEYDQAFKDRVAADLEILRCSNSNSDNQSGPVQSGRRTNAGKAADVREMLTANPELSDREISRRVGVSPQTVSTWRAKLRMAA